MDPINQFEISFTAADEIYQEAQEELAQQEAEFEQRKKEAKEDVLKRIYEEDAPFSYNTIEDIMHGHGLEMDYIEDFLL